MIDAVLVGCGAMSATWLAATREVAGLRIVGLVEIDPQRARERAGAEGLDGARIGSSLDEILTETHPAVVLDVVVPAARSSVVRTALAYGCHVLSEKPLATSLAEARDLIAAAATAGRIHAIVQNRRYLAGVRRIRRFLDSGAIGRPTGIHCDFFLAPHFGGFREEMAHVLLVDMAIHTFDACRAMTGLEARQVFCHEWNPANSWYRDGSSAIAIFEMAHGAVFSYRGSWCADGAPTSWECSWRIVAERGTLVWDGFDTIRAEVVERARRNDLFERTVPVEIPPLDSHDRIGGHLGVVRDFVAAIGGGPPPETAAAENLKSLAMVFGAIRSAESGQRVAIDHCGTEDRP